MKIKMGELKRIYNPSINENKEWYINDHTIINHNNTWHLFGITHEEPGDPLNEVLCAHATTEDLINIPFKKLPYPFQALKEYNEQHFWAPHIIKKDDTYYMFYCAGSLESFEKYQINLATSKDLYNWTRNPNNPLIIDGYQGRDPMIIHENNQWIMYYTATEAPSGGFHVVKAVTSNDLITWTNPKIVFKSNIKGTIAGPCESPFVLKYHEKYYLFIGPYGGYDIAYCDTAIYESDNPFEFKEEKLITRLKTHASEIIQFNNNYYITHCGWGMGGLYLAPLYFE